MPSRRSRAAPEPDGPGDDLKRIAGIGPAVATKLEAAGVRTYAAVAESTPAALAELVAGVAGTSSARIEEMDWIGQAQRLHDAPRATPAGGAADEPRPLVRVTRLDGSPAKLDGITVISLELVSAEGVTAALDCIVEITARTETGDECAIARFTARVYPGRSHSIGAGGPPIPSGRHHLVVAIAAFPAGGAGKGAPLWEGTAAGGAIEVPGDSP